jgi:hypothetical protein
MEDAGRFHFPKTSLQDRISKIWKGSEVQVPPVLLHWHLPNEPRCFSDLHYLPSHFTEIPQVGEDSGSVDELRRLERTESNVRTEELSLEPNKSEVVKNNVGHVDKIFKDFAHSRCQQTKAPKSKRKAERSENLTTTYRNKLPENRKRNTEKEMKRHLKCRKKIYFTQLSTSESRMSSCTDNNTACILCENVSKKTGVRM